MDEMELLAKDLVTAWRRYRGLFNEDPHGTEAQMKSLLALTRKFGAVMQKPEPEHIHHWRRGANLVMTCDDCGAEDFDR